jgi:hypothetical protein
MTTEARENIYTYFESLYIYIYTYIYIEIFNILVCFIFINITIFFFINLFETPPNNFYIFQLSFTSWQFLETMELWKPGVNLIIHFSLSMTKRPNKLEHLCSARLSCLFACETRANVIKTFLSVIYGLS